MSFVVTGQEAQVLRAGVGVLTLHARSTEQSSTADGSVITVANPSEGWHAVLKLETDPQLAPAGERAKRAQRNPWVTGLVLGTCLALGVNAAVDRRYAPVEVVAIAMIAAVYLVGHAIRGRQTGKTG